MTLSKSVIAGVLAIALSACGGAEQGEAPATPQTEQMGQAQTAAASLPEIVVTAEDLEGNPFLQDWDTPFGIPPFDEIEDSHFMPAFKQAMLEMRANVKRIEDNPAPPDFANTILALETRAPLASKVIRTFSNLAGTELSDELKQVQTQLWPMLTRENDAITMNEKLFARIDAVHAQADSLELGEQEARLLELTHRNFVRAGVALPPEKKAQVSKINAELSELSTRFGQNLLAATKAFTLEIKDEADLEGLSDSFKATLWNEEKAAWVVGLNRSAYETFMTQSANRELRQKLFDGYRLRAADGDNDNSDLLIKIAQLRAKRAELKGYDSHAHYELSVNMAKSPKGAEDFLLKVWQPGLERAKEERAEMQAMIGDEFTFAGHDWWHYSEKVRKQKFNIDETELMPYFELNAVRDGAFTMANKLFGITFTEVEIPIWNEGVRAFEVRDENDEHLGIFMMDMFARDSKRGGAWMNVYRGSSNIAGNRIRPIVTNNMNLSKPPQDEPALLRFGEVSTLFHEFGHGLHGLLTRIDYESFSGVYGPRDYTEFPAQILEHWPSEPEMLELYAKHVETGAIIPPQLVERMLAAANHNQGFKTTEYVAASLLDLRWHMLSSEEAAKITDAHAFEREVLEGYGIIDEIEPRYRSQYFSHTFSGGYSARYYAYLWSEILDADGFNAFKEAENIFDPETAARLKKWVYESGGLLEADELYRNFRGADPSIEPLLEGRGFKVQSSID